MKLTTPRTFLRLLVSKFTIPNDSSLRGAKFPLQMCLA